MDTKTLQTAAAHETTRLRFAPLTRAGDQEVTRLRLRRMASSMPRRSPISLAGLFTNLRSASKEEARSL